MVKILTPVDFAAGNVKQRNRVINGDMRISQENGDTVIPVTGTTITTAPYPVDMFKVNCNSTGTVNINQQATTDFLGFNYALKVAVAATEDPLASGANSFIYHAIEGNNVADLMWGTANAQPATLSFWVKSSLTGTYSVAIRNSASLAYYITEYTIDLANTPQKIEITIPGTTTGTWLTDENVGLQILWVLAAASDLVTSEVDTWRGDGLIASTNQINLLANLNATFELTGVQLEVGESATDFEHRDYANELVRCKRYYQKLNIYSYCTIAQYTNTGAFISHPISFPEMRAAPSASYEYTGGGAQSWGVLGGTQYSADDGNVTFNTARTSLRLIHARAAGGSTPVIGNYYSFGAGYNVHLKARL